MPARWLQLVPYKGQRVPKAHCCISIAEVKAHLGVPPQCAKLLLPTLWPPGCAAVVDGEIKNVSLSDYKGKYVILFWCVLLAIPCESVVLWRQQAIAGADRFRVGPATTAPWVIACLCGHSPMLECKHASLATLLCVRLASGLGLGSNNLVGKLSGDSHFSCSCRYPKGLFVLHDPALLRLAACP